ncbi:integrase [Longispora fulva]|uniref:DNA invertase Pin-like site-specific DNA recombinase n=1 Tax=Longispora fulva TaxID=619741 RepID=A0A8J7KT13_9ACTN|nr:recombinase family protein [Longispora fulva]MBG6140217.1 DNA invertase Pin-like site-specific DNA recombinase [Longispora fulva]GIG57406.1 integrase [Longispora fulva]
MTTQRAQPAKSARLRVLGVCRISRDSEESTSIERQDEAINAWCTMQGHVLVGMVHDVGVSGNVRPSKRPELGPWLNERVSDYDIIVVWKLDRLTRNLSHFLDFRKWMAKNGKELASCQEQFDTSTPLGSFFLNILIMFAEHERETIKARIASSKTKAVKDRRYHGGTIQYGTRPAKLDGGGYVLQHDPHSSKVMKRIVDDLINGDSRQVVAANLTDEGELSPSDYQRHLMGKETKGLVWHPATITNLATSRGLLGEREENGRTIRNDDGTAALFFPPLISEDTWEELQRKLKETTKSRTLRGEKQLYADMVFCGLCGSKMYRDSINLPERGLQRDYYTCGTNSRPEKGKRLKCPAKSVQQVEFDKTANELFLSSVGHLEKRSRRVSSALDLSKDIERMRRILNDVRGERDRGDYDYPGGDEDYEMRVTALTGELRALVASHQPQTTVTYAGTGKTYTELWNEAKTLLAQRQILLDAGIQVKVIVHKVATRWEPAGFQTEMVFPEDLKARLQAVGEWPEVPTFEFVDGQMVPIQRD